MDVRWAPPYSDQAADGLSKGLAEGSSPDLAGKVKFEEIAWRVLPNLLETGQDMYQQRKAALEEKKKEEVLSRPRRRKKEEKLQFRYPWM